MNYIQTHPSSTRAWCSREKHLFTTILSFHIEYLQKKWYWILENLVFDWIMSLDIEPLRKMENFQAIVKVAQLCLGRCKNMHLKNYCSE